MRLLAIGIVLLAACGDTIALSQSLAPQVPIPPPTPQDLQQTEAKNESLNQDMAALDATAALLKDLGKATEKRKGETSLAYVRRVNSIFKAQAYLIHLAHQRVESALDAKYQLEAQVTEYARWVDQLAASLPQRPQVYRTQVKGLLDEVRELRYDGQVLANLIVTQGGFDQAIKDRYAKEFPSSGVQQVPGYSARQQKFQQLPKEQWQQKFQELVRQIQVKEMKRQFLVVQAIPESEALAAGLPAEHRKVLQEATAILEKYSELESTADKVAIAAEYARDNLELVSGFVDSGTGFDPSAVEKTESAAKRLQQGLEPLIPAGVGVTTRVGIMMSGEMPSPSMNEKAVTPGQPAPAEKP